MSAVTSKTVCARGSLVLLIQLPMHIFPPVTKLQKFYVHFILSYRNGHTNFRKVFHKFCTYYLTQPSSIKAFHLASALPFTSFLFSLSITYVRIECRYLDTNHIITQIENDINLYEPNLVFTLHKSFHQVSESCNSVRLLTAIAIRFSILTYLIVLASTLVYHSSVSFFCSAALLPYDTLPATFN